MTVTSSPVLDYLFPDSPFSVMLQPNNLFFFIMLQPNSLFLFSSILLRRSCVTSLSTR